MQAVAQRPERVQDTMRSWFDKKASEIQRLAGRNIDPGVVMETALLCIQTTPKLAECVPATLFGGILRGIAAGLSFDPTMQEAFLIPRRDKRYGTDDAGRGLMVANFQMGYHGSRKLMERHGGVKCIIAHAVFEADDIDVDLGCNRVVHKPYLKGDRGEIVGAYARAVMLDGTDGPVEWLSGSDLAKIRDTSEAHMNAIRYAKPGKEPESPWHQWPDRMARKSAIQRLRHSLTLTPEAEAAFGSEERVTRIEGGRLMTDAYATDVGDPDAVGPMIEGDVTVPDEPPRQQLPESSRSTKAKPAPESVPAERGGWGPSSDAPEPGAD